ncbi:hypothetical protein [Tunturiibacter gelidiferens]|uniref:hypothetical protein n=1 Tax=Tunturiibacter gelidiferens TaxID=3069689 RepID=UPI003D9B8461
MWAFARKREPDTLKSPMPLGLKRYQQEGDDHFITFSCNNRKPYLNTPNLKRDLPRLPRTHAHELPVAT